MVARPNTSLVSRFALAVALVVLSTGCGGDKAQTPPTTPADSRSTTTAFTDTTTSAPEPEPEPEPEYRSWIANVKPEVTSVAVHETPGGPQLRLDTAGNGTLRPVIVENPLKSGAPTTFRVKQQGVESAGRSWVEVFLPVRPNEATGWVAEDDVILTHTDLSVTINLTSHRLQLFDAGAVVATYDVAVGEAATPTPTGSFYVKELVEPPKANGTYGPIAYGLSAFSPTLVDTEAFADGVIGSHGTNEPELIGTDVSHGCVRMRNADILDLEAHQVPLGMPVTITD